jgi:hypothetical protein
VVLIYKYIKDKNKTIKMVNQEVKSRINKIDFELKAFFENVYIKEKYYKTGFFEISANTIDFIRGTKDYKRLEAKVIINHPDLLKDNINWSYSTNPLNENAIWLDRTSTIETISLDIIDIIKEKRLSEDYIFNLESIVEVINEGKNEDDVLEKKTSTEDLITNILDKYKVNVIMKESYVHSVNEKFLTDASDRLIKLYHNVDFKVSDKFKIESEILTIENVNWCVFKKEHIEINFTPIL